MKRQKENVERENSLQITVHMLVVTRKLLGGIWLRKISYLIVLQGRNQFKIVRVGFAKTEFLNFGDYQGIRFDVGGELFKINHGQ